MLVIAVLITATAFAYLINGFERQVDATDITINGRYYVLLTDMCKAHGIEWEWDTTTRKIFLRKNNREAVFLVESKYYYENKEIKKLSAPVRVKKGAVYIPLKFVKYTVEPLFDLEKKALRAEPIVTTKQAKAETPVSPKHRIKKIVIDPGHGGKDPGAIGRTGLYEKTVVLDVSKRIRKELEKKGIDVIMTRDSDEFITLGKRARIANENKADLFVSIHANANKKRWIRGFEVYCLSDKPTDDNARALAAAENSVLKYEEESFGRRTKNLDAILWDITFDESRKESIDLAGFVCQEVSKKLKMKRNEVRSARFYVLKGALMPAVLIEMSYLSNRWDEKNLKKDSYKQKLAEGIANGISAFKGEYERTNGFSQ